MFLSKLNSKEKDVFCKLANYVACIDGIVEEELESLDLYNTEMGTNYHFKEDVDFSISDLIKELDQSTKEIKKIISFEIIGLANADTNYSQNERKAVDEICLNLEISKDTQKKMEEIVIRLLSTYKETAELLKE